ELQNKRGPRHCWRGPLFCWWGLARQLLSHDSQCLCGEVGEVREDRGQICRSNAEPLRECRGVLIDGRCRNPAALSGAVVGTVHGKRGEGSVEVAALYRTAHDQVMRTPCMVRAVAVR